MLFVVFSTREIIPPRLRGGCRPRSRACPTSVVCEWPKSDKSDFGGRRVGEEAVTSRALAFVGFTVAIVTSSLSEQAPAAQQRRFMQYQMVEARGCREQSHACATACLAYRPPDHWRNPDGFGMIAPKDPELAGDDVDVIHLRVWERLIAALEDLLLTETAGGGPDTSVRSRVVWRINASKAGNHGAMMSCARIVHALNLSRRRISLAVDASPGGSPQTGFSLLENQLYRVEIHDGDAEGTATFGWSRNGRSARWAR
jgi:hypothetical protein